MIERSTMGTRMTLVRDHLSLAGLTASKSSVLEGMANQFTMKAPVTGEMAKKS